MVTHPRAPVADRKILSMSAIVTVRRPSRLTSRMFAIMFSVGKCKYLFLRQPQVAARHVAHQHDRGKFMHTMVVTGRHNSLTSEVKVRNKERHHVMRDKHGGRNMLN